VLHNSYQRRTKAIEDVKNKNPRAAG